MFSLKKLGVTLGLCLGVILAVPSTAKAETENYWTTGLAKYTVVKHYDIDKLTPDKFVTTFLSDGLKNDMQGNLVYGIFQVKASSEKDAKKKFYSYIKKVKTAKTNKYGLSFGLKRNYDYNFEVVYDRDKKVATYAFPQTVTDMYFTQRLFDEAMKESYLEVSYNNRDTNVSTNFYRQKTKSVFKNADELKKASDSVKFQFLCEDLNRSCKIFTAVPDNPKYELSVKAIYDGECYGECVNLEHVWNMLASLVATDVETMHYTCYRDVSEFNHAATLIRVKNKNGKWDYFEGNNEQCVLFGNAFLKDYDKGVNIYKSKGLGPSYTNIEDWMHYDKKAYVEGYGSFGKSAYKYGKAHTKSELVNLMISKKAKYYDKEN